MKNENIVVKFTAFVLLITMIVLCLVSGTFAKYTSSFAGEDTAVVARWYVSDGNIEETFDIFDSSKIYDTLNADYSAGAVDEDVFNSANGGDDDTTGKIAPGTWGNFTYVLSNTSEVSAIYDVVYTADEAGVPLEWSLDGTDWSDDVTALNVSEEEMVVDGDTEITLYWRWVFEGGSTTDEEDTALGMAEELATPSIKIDVTFTQVD